MEDKLFREQERIERVRTESKDLRAQHDTASTPSLQQHLDPCS